ncbi:B3 domain-containing protein Os03g0120900 [Olea europaea subsp. europaea]|uniref:B3 domain-containing protein Os03g0120900 n=1 Tax=Olea europaea subsp. europaea TaxID=158383 RepID=A0A8S0RI96_OLEEU|nr:B3 domain-containing protein Os03g0120900 [Olea europaea subsp. europaea]
MRWLERLQKIACMVLKYNLMFFVNNGNDANILSRKQDDLPEDKNENMGKEILATKVREKVKGDLTISMGKSCSVEIEGKQDKVVPGMKEREKVKEVKTYLKERTVQLKRRE